jgi:hypothetical protein
VSGPGNPFQKEEASCRNNNDKASRRNSRQSTC